MATLYEYRLVTKVKQGSAENGYMNNEVEEYVVLGKWYGEETKTTVEPPEPEVSEEAAAEETTEQLDKEDSGERKFAVVNIMSDGSGGLVLLSEPDSNASTLTTIPNGTELECIILGDTTDWCKTTYKGYTGYVSTNYLDFTDEKTQTEGE